MAKFLSQIVSDIRGSINGITFSRNSSGGYARQKVSPVNPNTAKQANRRSIFGQLASEWRALSDAQRNAWRELAIANPTTDSLGQSVTLTGLQMYQRINTNLGVIGLSKLEDAPIAPAFPEVTVQSLDLSYEIDGNNWNAGAIDETGFGTATVGYTAVVYGTNVISQGRSFIRQSELKLLAVVPNPTGGLIEDVFESPTPAWGNVFSTPAVPGTYKWGFQIDLIHNASGFRQRVARLNGDIVVVQTP